MRYGDVLARGRWFDVTTPEQHKNLKSYGGLEPKQFGFANIQLGDYKGPGRYMLLQYTSDGRCGHEAVNSVLTAEEVAKRARVEMEELEIVLRQAASIDDQQRRMAVTKHLIERPDYRNDGKYQYVRGWTGGGAEVCDHLSAEDIGKQMEAKLGPGKFVDDGDDLWWDQTPEE